MLRPPRHPQPPHRSRRIGLPGLAETAPTGSRSAKTRRLPCRIPFRQNRPQSGTRPVRFRSPPNRPEDFRRYGCSAVCEHPSPNVRKRFGRPRSRRRQHAPRSRYRILRPPCGSPPASGIHLHSGTRMPQTVRNLSQAGTSAAFESCSRTTIFMKSIFYDSHFSNSGTELVGVHVERRPQRLHPADATTKHGSIKTIRL